MYILHLAIIKCVPRRMISQSENLHPLPPTRSGLHPYILTVYSQPVMLRAWFAFLLPNSILLPHFFPWFSLYTAHFFIPSTLLLSHSLVHAPCYFPSHVVYAPHVCIRMPTAISSPASRSWSGLEGARLSNACVRKTLKMHGILLTPDK